MKAKTFENLIRKIVREEIDYALRREIKSLKEDLRDEIKPIIKEEPTKLKSSLNEKIIGNTPIKKQYKKQQFAQNSTLNDLLNETAMGNTNTETSQPHASLSDPFSSPNIMPSEGLPPAVANAVNRDYSGLMEAINKKKGK